MKIGVLGVGVIGSSIIEGFCLNGDDEHELFVSPRNETRSLFLSETYASVKRCESNQMVLDQAELIIISVLPQKGLEIIKELKFNKNHRVINLMSDKKLEEIQCIIGQTQSLVHMVPLSFISRREGPIALYPSDEVTEKIFNKLGHIITVDDVNKIQSIAAITGLMTSYYKLLNDVNKWGQAHHLSSDESKDYTTSFFEALSKHAKEGPLDVLANEMTPGGLNELALRHIDSLGGFDHWTDVLNPMLNRVKRD